jgi:hypothetical protein
VSGKLDYMLSVMVDPTMVPLIDAAALKDNRPRSSYVRNLIVNDLKDKGLVDADGAPTPAGQAAIVAWEATEQKVGG